MTAMISFPRSWYRRTKAMNKKQNKTVVSKPCRKLFLWEKSFKSSPTRVSFSCSDWRVQEMHAMCRFGHKSAWQSHSTECKENTCSVVVCRWVGLLNLFTPVHHCEIFLLYAIWWILGKETLIFCGGSCQWLRYYMLGGVSVRPAQSWGLNLKASVFSCH